MAYESKEWVCGETITADGLNNLEEGVQEALECCEGGGTVEVVKIATAQGGGGGTPYLWSGGFSLPNGVTIGDLVGDKQIIDFAYQAIATFTNNTNLAVSSLMQLDVADGYVSGKSNPLTFTQEEIKGIDSGGIYGLILQSSSAATYTVDVYAICI